MRAGTERVLVGAVKAVERQTASGLWVAGDIVEERRQSRGVVAFVGSGRMLKCGKVDKPPVEVGDVILFSKYGNERISHDGNDYIAVQFSDIEAVVEP